MMAVPSLWVAFGEVPAKEQFANVHYRRAFLLLGRKSNLFWTRVIEDLFLLDQVAIRVAGFGRISAISDKTLGFPLPETSPELEVRLPGVIARNALGLTSASDASKVSYGGF